MKLDDIRVGERHRKNLGDIASLAKSIDEIGLLHPPVVTPDGQLIAGYRRIAAMRMLGWTETPVTTVDIASILRGEFDENACRKDFAPSEWVAIRRELEPLEREAARERQEAQDYGRGVTSENFSEVTGRALDRVAQAIGVSRPTLEKATQVINAAEQDPDRYAPLVTQMDETGNVNRAYLMLRREQAREALHDAPPLEGKYRVLYADPPWAYGDNGIIGADNYGHAARHYPAMSIEQLCAIPVKELAEENAVLFLWVTSPILPECFTVIKAWGFEYKASFVWDKVRHNWGHYNSVRHELLLLCTRGSCLPESRELHDSVITLERSQEHSEKPEYFRQLIDEMYPSGPRIELFARSEAEGWIAWGNQ